MTLALNFNTMNGMMRCEYVLWSAIRRGLMILLFSTPFIMKAQEGGLRIIGGNIRISEVFQQIEEQTIYTIAFNHEELDVSKTVDMKPETISLQDLLSLILKDTGCDYKIADKHIIVTLLSKQTEKSKIEVHSVQGVRQGDSFEYTGQVLEGEGDMPLEYATISLLDENSRPLLSGVSNNKGMFRLVSTRPVQQLRVSFIGYKTQLIEISQGENVGVIVLEEDEKMLNEVKVTASGVLHAVDRNAYIITPQMIEGISNAQELLNKIHGVRFDMLSNTIKVGNQTNVLLLVDGMQQSQEYIKNLLPERINKIEIVNEPSGRFLSEGYSAIINFILKKDYTGYDIFLSNFNIVNPAGTNGSDWLMNEQPGISFTYTRNKFNIYGTLAYGWSRWNTAINKDISYSAGRSLISDYASTDDPNDKYKYRGNYAGGGVNYQINPEHVLSFQGDYTYSNIFTESLFEMRDKRPDMHYEVNKLTSNKTKDDDYVGTLFYKGKIDKLSLYSDISYNYYSNQVDNEFIQTGSQEFREKNLYNENKKQSVFNLEGEYEFSDKLSVNTGYSNVWRRYGSKGEYDVELLNYKEKRHKFWGYVSFHSIEEIQIKTGLGVELISIDNKKEEKTYKSIQPYLQVNYAINKNLNVNLSYAASSTYPSLFQLSELKSFIDSSMVQVGNPYLKPVTRHSVSGWFTLWDRLSVIPGFQFVPKEIGEVHVEEYAIVNRTFENMDMKEYNLRIIYDQPIGRYFSLKSSAFFYYSKVKYAQVSNSAKGWLLDSEINYYHPDYALGAQFGYYRGLQKKVMLQGYQMEDMDAWLLTVNKQFWNKRLSVHLSYIPPIGWGVRHDQERKVDTPFYREASNLNLKTYDNMILLRLSLRFDSGKVKRTNKESQIERETREKRTVGF